jgi:CubicO group peptidase (beta-lactamase class C family)
VRAPRLALLLLLAAGCARTPPPAAPEPARLEAVPVLSPAPPASVGMHPGLGARLDSVVAAALAEGAASGAAVSVGRHGRLVHQRGYGRTLSGAGGHGVTDSTLFDLASLTKVVGTTTAAMILEEEGRLQLERPVADYLPAFTDSAKRGITVRMLLTHRGGMEAGAPLYRQRVCRAEVCREGLRGREEYLEAINARPLRRAPGTATEYSDWDLILMQLVIESITGQPLDRFLEERVWRPLGMRDTGFAPLFVPLSRVAATSADRSRGGLIHGEVHDPNAWAMGGVAGHAGLFSSARDLAVFAQMLLNGGEYGGARILRPETLARWTAPQDPGSSRALGWDTPSGRSSAGRFFGPRSFGHTGFTGTSLWIDPERGLFTILLTNRVHTGGDNQRHVPLRRAVADAVQTAILDAPLVDWEVRR